MTTAPVEPTVLYWVALGLAVALVLYVVFELSWTSPYRRRLQTLYVMIASRRPQRRKDGQT